jgi:hypothetical protein
MEPKNANLVETRQASLQYTKILGQDLNDEQDTLLQMLPRVADRKSEMRKLGNKSRHELYKTGLEHMWSYRKARDL